MIDRIPPLGRTLIRGPTGVGKTRLTAAALDRWIGVHGAENVAILEFAPEIERDGRLIGGRLERFTTIPSAAWSGTIDAHAPRLEGATAAKTRELAAHNAAAARSVIESLPADVAAVFGNDVTIPFQHPSTDPHTLLDRLHGADLVVLNAFAGDDLGGGAVTGREREVLNTLERWVENVVELDGR